MSDKLEVKRDASGNDVPQSEPPRLNEANEIQPRGSEEMNLTTFIVDGKPMSFKELDKHQAQQAAKAAQKEERQMDYNQSQADMMAEEEVLFAAKRRQDEQWEQEQAALKETERLEQSTLQRADLNQDGGLDNWDEDELAEQANITPEDITRAHNSATPRLRDLNSAQPDNPED